MKLPPDMQFHQDVRLLIYRPRGLIDEPAVNKIIAVIEDIEAATREPFNRFSDASETHEVELNFRYVIQVSLHRLTEGSSIKVRVFQDRGEAAKWLSVPAELLAPKSDDGGNQK